MCRIVAVALSAVLGLAVAGCGESEPAVDAAPPALRLLTETQYRNVVADVFGAHIAVVGRFDPLFRTNGLLALGARNAEITPAAMERYERLAQQIAAQVMDPVHRRSVMPCIPASGRDDACASRALGEIGRLLYRRALSADETAAMAAVAAAAARLTGDPYRGLQAALAQMLVSPDFLFVADQVEPDPSGGVRLTDHAVAARLSFFLWNTAPDPALLDAAERGELATPEGRARQVDRMLASPLLERAVRNFFDDMLHLGEFETVEKDSLIYPLFNIAVAQDAREQTLRTITLLLIDEGGDYRDLFTTRRTFISAALGRIYQVPVSRPDGGWTEYEFPEGDQRAGLLAQIGFAALNSHAGRSSPTLRGKAVREVLLCQKVPDPPPDVDFTQFNDPSSPLRTARERLTAHNEVPTCAGCHKLTDPIGLGLERLDGAGQLRDTENGAPILTDGDFDGVPFTDIPSLARALRNSPAVPACLVNRAYALAMLRTPEASDRLMLDHLAAQFADSGYKLRPLLRRIATSRAFVAVGEPSSTSFADN